MKRSLNIVTIYKDAFTIGIKNAISILITTFLYSITSWIPYINVGTTIAMATLPGKLAQGEVISPFFIFKSVYRGQIGNFFLYTTFYLLMLVSSILFLNVFFPIILIMYSLSLYIMIDAEVNPLEAFEMSRKATNGYKADIFIFHLFFEFAVWFIASFFIGGSITAIKEATETYSDYTLPLISLISAIITIFILTSCFRYGLHAVIYRELFLKVQEQPEEPTAPKIERVFRREIEATKTDETNNNPSPETPANPTIPNEN